MDLTADERRALKDELLNTTREGSITGWTERIAQWSQTAGLPVNRINWTGSPETVAYRVVEFAEKWDIKLLKAALS